MKRTASSVVCEALLGTVTVFTLSSLLFLPVLTEGILLSLYDESRWIILSCCSAVLLIASVISALDLGAFVYEDDMMLDDTTHEKREERKKKQEQFWCPSFSKCGTLTRGSYIIYSCSFWQIVNMCTSLATNTGVTWYITLFAFTPVLVYGPLFFAGYTFIQKIRELENKKD